MDKCARTAITGAENGAREQTAYSVRDKLSKYGFTLKKEWLATLDARTRDSHAAADAQQVGIDEPFDVGGVKLMYPGDPSGPAREIYNCRCRRQDIVGGFDEVEPAYRRDQLNGQLIKDMSYKEWEQARMNTTGASAPSQQGQLRAYTNDLAQKLDRANYDAMMDAVDNCTNADAQALLNKHADEIEVVDKNTAGIQHCEANSSRIHINEAKNATGDTINTPYQVTFHESGHALDYATKKALGTSGYTFSSSYNGGELQKTIKAEVKSIVDDYDNKLKADFALHATDYDWLHDNKFISDWDYTFWKKNGTMLATPRYAKTFAYKAFERELGTLPKRSVSDLCDMAEGATGAKIHVVSGHGAKYWKDRSFGNDCGLATEAFAEMYSGEMANADSIAVIKQYLPKSYGVFCDMLKTMI